MIKCINVINFLSQNKFTGSININTKEVRNNSGEIIDISIPDSIYQLKSKYRFTRVVIEPQFSYFVMDGFKGANFGLLFTEKNMEEIIGFYDIKFIRKLRIILIIGIL